MTIASEEVAMPKRSEATDREALAALFRQMEEQPPVFACRALVRAAFLFTNSPSRPYHALGLNVSQADVLATIGRAEGMALTCSEIAEATVITKGGITGIVDRLEARGLVQRVASREDRRSILIHLTDKGVEVCNDLYREIPRTNQETLAKALKPEQIKQLSKLLTLLVRSLEAENRTARIRASEPTHGRERI
jgi:DNA-binding MarR family transcriptional regulator